MSVTLAGADAPPVPASSASPRPALPALALLDAPRPSTRGPVLGGLLAIGVFVGAFAAWGVLAPLSEAAIAPGVIKAEGNRRTVQHLEGGIVREILARDGDAVTAGQVLMRLDEVSSNSSLEALRATRWALLAQDARLAAEMAGAQDVAFHPTMLAAPDPRAQEAVTGQRILFASRLASFNSQMQLLESRLAQHEATITSARAQVVAQRRQLELLRREETDVADLVRQGLERRPRLLALQRQGAAVEGNLLDLTGQVERAQAQIAETRAEMRRTRDQRLAEAGTEAREVRQRLLETDERLRAAEDVASRREIVAPEDGTVLSSRFFNVGAVVRAGEPVLELVPARDRLVAEVRVSPTDIDTVHTGLTAEVRLPAFKQRVIPYLHGQVTFVGGDVNQDAGTNTPPYYRARVEIPEEQLRGLQGVELRAGMPVETMIKVGERSFFRYMVQPLLDSFNRAFREQ